jgi:hypothetical protein
MLLFWIFCRFITILPNEELISIPINATRRFINLSSDEENTRLLISSHTVSLIGEELIKWYPNTHFWNYRQSSLRSLLILYKVLFIVKQKLCTHETAYQHSVGCIYIQSCIILNQFYIKRWWWWTQRFMDMYYYYPIFFISNKHILYKIDINIWHYTIYYTAQNLHRTMNPYNHAILNIKINLDKGDWE